MTSGIRNESASPVFRLFGDNPMPSRPLGELTAHERIGSVWGLVVQRVIAFHETLSPRQRANFAPEDICCEVYASLSQKDHLWEPAEGKYTTFTGFCISNVFDSIRDRSRTVQSPRNSGTRLKGYEAEGEALSARKEKTVRDIQRTSGDLRPIEYFDSVCEVPPAQQVAEGEHRAKLHAAVLLAIRTAPTREALVLGMYFGLFGRERLHIKAIARRLNLRPKEVKRLSKAGMDRVKASCWELASRPLEAP